MEPIKINLPIVLEKGKRKVTYWSLNLNEYRNASYFLLNDMKILFGEIVKPRIAHLPIMSKLKIEYTLFFGSHREIDVANVCSIVDKFFCDTLKNNNKIPDDNRKILNKVIFGWGDVDKENPRVEAIIYDYELKEEEPMRITYTQDEIEEALRMLLNTQITVREDQTIQIEFQATRGNDGMIANVTIGKAGADTNARPRTSSLTVTPRPPLTEGPSVEDLAKARIEQLKAEARAKEEEAKLEGVTKEPEKPQETQKTEVAPVAAKGSLFPSVATSAPAAATPPAPSPAAPAKGSLFGNLAPPVHDPKVPV